MIARAKEARSSLDERWCVSQVWQPGLLGGGPGARMI